MSEVRGQQLIQLIVQASVKAQCGLPRPSLLQNSLACDGKKRSAPFPPEQRGALPADSQTASRMLARTIQAALRGLPAS